MPRKRPRPEQKDTAPGADLAREVQELRGGAGSEVNSESRALDSESARSEALDPFVRALAGVIVADILAELKSCEFASTSENRPKSTRPLRSKLKKTQPGNTALRRVGKSSG